MKKFFKHMGWKMFLANVISIGMFVLLVVVMLPSILSGNGFIRGAAAFSLTMLGCLGFMSFYSQWQFYRRINPKT